jgi:hypothetical protein
MGLLLMFAAFIGLAFASFLWGVDSRRGFSDGRVERPERWFPHSRTD